MLGALPSGRGASGHPRSLLHCPRRIAERPRSANGGPNADVSPRGRIGFVETVALLFCASPSADLVGTRQRATLDGTGFTTAWLLAAIREFFLVRASTKACDRPPCVQCDRPPCV